MTLLVVGGGFALLFAIYYYAFSMSTDNEPTVPLIVKPTSMPVSPETAPQATQSAKVPLSSFCRYIERFEGANPANNNPANARCSPVGYLAKYGHVTCNPNDFAVFPTYQQGWDYLNELCYHRIVLHPEWSFYDFFASYAPSTDGNQPKHYAEVIAGDCGKLATDILSQVLLLSA